MFLQAIYFLRIHLWKSQNWVKCSLIAKLTLKITILDNYKMGYIFLKLQHMNCIYLYSKPQHIYSMKKLTITQLTIMAIIFYNRVFGTTPQILRKVLQDVPMTWERPRDKKVYLKAISINDSEHKFFSLHIFRQLLIKYKASRNYI